MWKLFHIPWLFLSSTLIYNSVYNFSFFQLLWGHLHCIYKTLISHILVINCQSEDYYKPFISRKCSTWYSRTCYWARYYDKYWTERMCRWQTLEVRCTVRTPKPCPSPFPELPLFMDDSRNWLELIIAVK